MTSETTNEIQIDDSVLYVGSEEGGYEECKVVRVTKTMFVIDKEPVAGRTAPYKFELNTSSCWMGSDRPSVAYHAYYRPSRFSGERHHRVYRDTEDNRAMITARAMELHEKKVAERQRKAEQRAAAEKKHADEIAEVRRVCGCSIGMPVGWIRMMDTKPDGTRLYVLNIPVKEEFASRKNDWETIMLVCRDVEEIDYRLSREVGEVRKVKRVESALTCINGSSSSFASVSTSKYDADEEALWDAIRYQYFSW